MRFFHQLLEEFEVKKRALQAQQHLIDSGFQETKILPVKKALELYTWNPHEAGGSGIDGSLFVFGTKADRETWPPIDHSFTVCLTVSPNREGISLYLQKFDGEKYIPEFEIFTTFQNVEAVNIKSVV